MSIIEQYKQFLSIDGMLNLKFLTPNKNNQGFIYNYSLWSSKLQVSYLEFGKAGKKSFCLSVVNEKS